MASKSSKRVPYGSETFYLVNKGMSPGIECCECSVKIGELHLDHCDKEECPIDGYHVQY